MIGTASNPIGLDSEDEQVDIQTKLEEARRRQLIQQAKITKKPIELCFAVIKTMIKGQRKIKNKTLNRSIINYYKNKINLNISCEYFQPRTDPNYQDNPINPKQLILYGVDFLTTTMIHDRFNLLGTTILQIKWINSSSCKLIYRTEDEAFKVLESQIADPKALEGKREEETHGQLQGWFTLKNYFIYSFERELFMRYSTDKQNNICQEPLNKYKSFLTVQDQLLSHLFDQYNATQAYQDVIRQIQRQRNMQFRHHRTDNRNRRIEYNRSRTRDKYRRNRQYDTIQRQQRNTQFNRRRDNRQRKSYEPQNYENQYNRSTYPHRPAGNNWNRQNNKRNIQQQQQLKAPRRDNVYYDCNDIEEDDNLSYNLMPPEQQSQSESQHFNVIQNTSFQVTKTNPQIANHSNSVDKHQLSLIVNSLIQKEDKSLDLIKDSKAQISFVINEQKRVEEQDCSFIKAASKERSLDVNKQEEEQDYSILFNIIEQISPVHHNTFDSSFVVKSPKPKDKKESIGPKTSNAKYLDYIKPEKNKIREKYDDEGY